MKLIGIKLSVLTAALMISLSGRGETHYRPHLSVGGHGGVSLGKMSFSPSVKQGWLMGPEAGVSIRYAEEKIFGLVGEINFSQRGWNETFDDASLSYKRTLNYISIPVMTHIYFGSSRFKGFVNLGPEVSFMVSDNISSNFDYHNPASVGISGRQTDQLTMEVSNKFDYGITAGLGAEYYVKPRHSIYLECRFYYGLGNIFPSKRADTFSASRTMSLSATLGYNFRLK